MKQKSYFQVVTFVFTVVTVAHALRLLNHWPIQVGTLIVPLWVSWLAVFFAGFLAYNGFKQIGKK